MHVRHSIPVLLASALLAAASGCSKPAEAQAAAAEKKAEAVALGPVQVTTGEVTHLKMPRFLTLTGSIQADRQSDVAANVAGRVTATYVERGMPVKAGQPIALVDSKAAGFQQSAAVAQLQAAQTQEVQAKLECDRADTLFAQGAIPKAEFDRLKSTCTAQLFTANAARANADLASKLAGDTVIRAPLDGFVGERFINVGEYVQASTKVATVFAINPARVQISVPEPAVAMIKEGQLLNIEVAAFPERVFPATVRYVSPALRQNTRDLIIEATARNDDLSLRPGMFAMVRLTLGEEEQPTVPVDAIRSEGTVKRLFLARNGQAFELVVRTGISREGRTVVMEPLAAGEKVIVKPPPGLHDGSSIQ
jgi:membrane fusion protein (multidrug efflux system)